MCFNSLTMVWTHSLWYLIKFFLKFTWKVMCNIIKFALLRLLEAGRSDYRRPCVSGGTASIYWCCGFGTEPQLPGGFGGKWGTGRMDGVRSESSYCRDTSRWHECSCHHSHAHHSPSTDWGSCHSTHRPIPGPCYWCPAQTPFSSIQDFLSKAGRLLPHVRIYYLSFAW